MPVKANTQSTSGLYGQVRPSRNTAANAHAAMLSAARRTASRSCRSVSSISRPPTAAVTQSVLSRTASQISWSTSIAVRASSLYRKMLLWIYAVYMSPSAPCAAKYAHHSSTGSSMPARNTPALINARRMPPERSASTPSAMHRPTNRPRIVNLIVATMPAISPQTRSALLRIGPGCCPYSSKASVSAAIRYGRQNSSALSPRENAPPISTHAPSSAESAQAARALMRRSIIRQARQSAAAKESASST